MPEEMSFSEAEHALRNLLVQLQQFERPRNPSRTCSATFKRPELMRILRIQGA